MSSFVAIDFETANAKRISPCSVGLVKVVDNIVVDAFYSLINPETTEWTQIAFSIHGITPAHVKGFPNFSKIWDEEMWPFIDGVDFLIGHNVKSIEKSIINQCCDLYNIERPYIEYKCSMQLAKKVYEMKRAGLEQVCNAFDFDIIHHNALSDALASARLAINFYKDREAHKRFGKYELSDEEKKVIDDKMFNLTDIVEEEVDAIEEELRLQKQHMESIKEEILIAENLKKVNGKKIKKKNKTFCKQEFNNDEIDLFDY